MSTAMDNGRACWVDLSTPDVAAVEDFYRSLFGWTIDRHEAEMGEYTVGSIGDRRVAGMMAPAHPTEAAPTAWTVHFHVNDLEATLGAVTSAGGSVVTPPFDIPGEGRLSIVADPGGATLALYGGASPAMPYFSQDVGAVGWVELMTRDPALAAGFYYQVFGWVATAADADGVAYTAFELEHGHEHQPVAGMLPTPAELPADTPDVWSVYFNVADCVATVASATAHGGQVVKPPTDTPMGPFAVLADPAGAVFQVMQFVESST